jgi:hypothetical protein
MDVRGNNLRETGSGGKVFLKRTGACNDGFSLFRIDGNGLDAYGMAGGQENFDLLGEMEITPDGGESDLPTILPSPFIPSLS